MTTVSRRPLVLDLFAGPGGWDEGVRPLGLTPRGVELDDDACRTARAAGHHRHKADVAAAEPLDAVDAWGRCRGLLASPPCQGFSMAGNGRGRADSAHLLDALARVSTRSHLESAIAGLHESMTDDRSVLALEPLRWTLALTPSWVAWEQVATVQPLWDACATVLARVGYSVETRVLTSEQFGVPQTRRRAVLVARAPWFTAEHGPARLPAPTHSRFHSRDRRRLDPGVKPWVSMAQAIEWGMTERPAMTVTSGGARTGGAEPFGNAARQGILRERDAGRWALRSGHRDRSAVRGLDEPAPTMAFGHDSASVAWVLRSNYSGSNAGGKSTATERGRTLRRLDEPATAITGRPPSWALDGSDAGRQVRDGGSAAVRITVEEAAALQTFPVGYPWRGNKGKQYEQVGNAVPPLLARAIVAEVAAIPDPLR